MDKRLMYFFAGAVVPLVILTALFPDTIFDRKGVSAGEKYMEHPGADIVAYVREGCPHCAQLHEFALEHDWVIDYREVTKIHTNKQYHDLKARVPGLTEGTPTTIIDGRVFLGYDDHEKSGAGLKAVYDNCKGKPNGCMSYDDFMKSNKKAEVEVAKKGTCTEKCEADLDKYKFDLWLIGEVDLLDYSLPALAMLLGGLDGFNPCAMWVLITLLTLLINTNDWKKIWIVGGTFLFISGAVYYLFIAAWLNVFLILGVNMYIQIIIGLVAIFGGAFYLYEAFGKDPNQCKVTNLKQRQKTISKMKKVMEYTSWPAMIIGVSILAVSVNMIELVCTAGLPAIFTQILALNEVSNTARYSLIGLYILMYMIDDMIIFAIAITSLKASGITTKYRRFSLIFGGVLMYTLGILLIFFPDALAFHG